MPIRKLHRRSVPHRIIHRRQSNELKKQNNQTKKASASREKLALKAQKKHKRFHVPSPPPIGTSTVITGTNCHCPQGWMCINFPNKSLPTIYRTERRARSTGNIYFQLLLKLFVQCLFGSNDVNFSHLLCPFYLAFHFASIICVIIKMTCHRTR